MDYQNNTKTTLHGYKQKALSCSSRQRVGIKVIIPQSIYFYFKSTDFIVFIHILCIILFFEVIPFLNQK